MGTAVETAAVRHLQANGYPDAERIVLHGALDHGDIRLRRRPSIVAECKRAQLGLKLGPWMDELVEEVVNEAAEFGLLIMKQRGAGDRRVGRWATAMPFDWFMLLLERVNNLALSVPGVRYWQVTPYPIGQINRAYVPRLVQTDPIIPDFIVSNSPGRPDHRFVVGRLEYFLHIMNDLGYAQREE